MKKLIEQLRRLDLSTYPEGEIKKLISQVGQIGFMTVIFHPGKELMRARPNLMEKDFIRNQIFHLNHRDRIPHTKEQVRQIGRCFMQLRCQKKWNLKNMPT